MIITVKRLITSEIKYIVDIIYVCFTLYIYYVYINSHASIYLRKYFRLHTNTLIYNMNSTNVNIYVNTCQYFQIYTVCVYIYLYTHM